MNGIKRLSYFFLSTAAAFAPSPIMPVRALAAQHRSPGQMLNTGHNWSPTNVMKMEYIDNDKTDMDIANVPGVESEIPTSTGKYQQLKRQANRFLHYANQAMFVSILVLSLMASPAVAKGGGGRYSGGRSSSGSSSSMSRSSSYRSSSSSGSGSSYRRTVSSPSTSYRAPTKSRSSSSSSKRSSGGSISSHGSSSSSSRSPSGPPPKVFSSKPSVKSSSTASAGSRGAQPSSTARKSTPSSKSTPKPTPTKPRSGSSATGTDSLGAQPSSTARKSTPSSMSTPKPTPTKTKSSSSATSSESLGAQTRSTVNDRTPDSNSAPKSNPTATSAPQMKRRSVGRIGGRVERGLQSPDDGSSSKRRVNGASPVATPSPPRQAETTRSSRTYSSRPRRNYHQTSSNWPPTTVYQDKVVIVEAPTPSTSFQRANQPELRASTPSMVTSRNRNPWPERLGWASAGGLATAGYYESQTKGSAQKKQSALSDRVVPPSNGKDLFNPSRDSANSIIAFDPVRDSGLYVGSTSESDGTAQNVETNLYFWDDGRIMGNGFDEEDGPYTVQGSWSGSAATWTEKYGDYSVNVTCELEPSKSFMLPNSRTLHCTFSSSYEDISGSFTLRRQEK